MSDIEFVEALPKSKHKGAPPGVTLKTIETLKTRPGVWAKIAPASTSNAAAQKANRFRNLGCEAVSRDVDVFARWPVQPNGNGAS